MSLALHIAAAWITASILLAVVLARAARHRPRPRPTPAHPEGPHMSDRLTVSTINSDQLDALQLQAARMEHATKQAAELRVRLEDAEAGITAAIRQRKLAEDVAARAKELLARRTETLRKRAERAEAAIARVRVLHRPVDYRGTRICAQCSGYDGDSCDNSPCGYEHCPTLAALNELGPEETDTCRPVDVDGQTIRVRGRSPRPRPAQGALTWAGDPPTASSTPSQTPS